VPVSDISQSSSESFTDGNPRARSDPRVDRAVQTLDVAESLGYHLGNAFMYLATMGHTGDAIADLHRAIFHIESEITRLERKGNQRGS
jgi:hypothetical protein